MSFSDPATADWRKHAGAFSRRIVAVCCGGENAPDAGARAALRRGVGQPVTGFSHTAHRSILTAASTHGPESTQDAWLTNQLPYPAPAWERAYYAVAALIAAQPRSARDAALDIDPATRLFPLGAATGRLDRAAGVPKDETSPRERELAALTRLSLDGVHRRLPRLVRLVTAGQYPQHLDWGELILDLAMWPVKHDEIAKRWNQDYYRSRFARAQGSEPTPTDAENDENEAA